MGGDRDWVGRSVRCRFVFLRDQVKHPLFPVIAVNTISPSPFPSIISLPTCYTEGERSSIIFNLPFVFDDTFLNPCEDLFTFWFFFYRRIGKMEFICTNVSPKFGSSAFEAILL